MPATPPPTTIADFFGPVWNSFTISLLSWCCHFYHRRKQALWQPQKSV
jgi:hypothetical protein